MIIFNHIFPNNNSKQQFQTTIPNNNSKQQFQTTIPNNKCEIAFFSFHCSIGNYVFSFILENVNILRRARTQKCLKDFIQYHILSMRSDG
jgi:hypothetical protein